MLEVEGLKAWYGAAQVLFEPSFHVGHGEVVALMGRNGAGKSTTLKALMALIPQRSGRVRFLDEDISDLKPFQIARRGLGFVPEDRRLFSDLTVAENLDIGRQPVRHLDGRPAPSWTMEKLFTIFPNLRDMSDRRGGRRRHRRCSRYAGRDYPSAGHAPTAARDSQERAAVIVLERGTYHAPRHTDSRRRCTATSVARSAMRPCHCSCPFSRT